MSIDQGAVRVARASTLRMGVHSYTVIPAAGPAVMRLTRQLRCRLDRFVRCGKACLRSFDIPYVQRSCGATTAVDALCISFDVA